MTVVKGGNQHGCRGVIAGARARIFRAPRAGSTPGMSPLARFPTVLEIGGHSCGRRLGAIGKSCGTPDRHLSAPRGSRTRLWRPTLADRCVPRATIAPTDDLSQSRPEFDHIQTEAVHQVGEGRRNHHGAPLARAGIDYMHATRHHFLSLHYMRYMHNHFPVIVVVRPLTS